jgi:gamma-glutamylcyclotransferase (GGCT)/AIG2-like uncharacterized protein YtfP
LQSADFFCISVEFLLGLNPIMYMNENRTMFTYGTLIDNGIRSRVLGKETMSYPAELKDYELTIHSYCPFLTIKKSVGSVVKGIIFEVNDNDLRRLDQYENSLYDRIIVNVKVNYKSDYDCYTYIEKPEERYILSN